MSARRFVVGVSGSAGSLQALRHAALLARSEGAVLAPVLAWTPPGGDMADRHYPSPELRRVWQQAAWGRLWRAIELAFGGPPADVAFSPEVLRGEAGHVLTRFAAEPGDVLVIGAGRRGSMRRLLACHVTRYCVGHASCPVVVVPPSPLEEELHGLHGWRLRHRMHPEDAGLSAADA
ncbi:MAG TPA: universal stress protein [Streptosporangiaceae bacterium]|nr:universal stress protein [Streptosporangiaceae bacterium]